MTGTWQDITVKDGSTMRLYVVHPENQGPAPAIIVLQEIFGVNEHIRDVTERLAQLGYLAVAPDLFHRTAPGFQCSYTDREPAMQNMQALTEAGIIADLQAVETWLGNEKSADISKLGAVGFCLGGHIAFIANSVLPLKAAVSFYGGRIAPDLLPKAALQKAPIFFWGGKDAHIGPEKRRAVADEMSKHSKIFTMVEFSEADHGFFCNFRSSYHEASAKQAFAMLKEFLRENL